MDGRRPALRAGAAASVVLLAVFFVYPLATILQRGLGQEGGLDLPVDVLASESTLRVLWFTVWQAALSTGLTLAAGLPLAWVVGRFDFPGRALVRALVLVPFVLPTVVVERPSSRSFPSTSSAACRRSSPRTSSSTSPSWYGSSVPAGASSTRGSRTRPPPSAQVRLGGCAS